MFNLFSNIAEMTELKWGNTSCKRQEYFINKLPTIDTFNFKCFEGLVS